MRLFKVLVYIVIIFSITCFSGFADMYKWIDENGVVHYSDTPPPQSTPKKSKVETLPTVQSTYVEEPTPEKNNKSSKKKTTQKEINKEKKRKTKSRTRYSSSNQVELFTTAWCFYCKKAKKFLESKGVPYTEYDVEKDRSAAIRFKRLNQRGGVPFAIINGQYLNGFRESSYDTALIK